MSEDAVAGPRWPDRVLDGSVLAFAWWTLCVHVTRFAGGSLAELVVGAGGTGLLLLVATRCLGGRTPSPAPAIPRAPEADRPVRPGLRVAAVAAALGVAVLGTLGAGLWVFWSAALLLCLALVCCELRRPVAAPPPPREAHAGLLLVAGAFCIAVTLCAHRPDADDAFFVNLAVAAADAPFEVLGARDTLHGLAGLPAGLPAGIPTYRLHSIELLEGAVAWLAGVRAIAVAHLGLAAVAAGLLPLALARAARWLVPGAWPAAVALALLALVAFGDTHQAYGNFGLVRLHQGKAVFVSLVVPVIVAYGLEFAVHPGLRTWLRLAAVQIAGVGLSASALWIGPAVAGLALASFVPLSRGGARTLARGLGASAYPLAAAALLAGATRDAVVAHDLPRDPTALADHARAVVFGAGPAAGLAWLALLGGFGLVQTSVARRVVLGLALGLLALLWNPALAPWLAEHGTGASTYWRVFWVVPVPLLLGVAAGGAIELAGRRGRRSHALAVAGVCAVAILAAPATTTLSPGNRVRLGAPGLDVPQPEFRAAEALARYAPPGSPVLAPYRVATWVPTLPGHPVPLAVRPDYLIGLREVLGEQEVARRWMLVDLVSGPGADARAARLLSERLAEGSLAAVCVDAAAPPVVRRVLGDAGLAEREVIGPYRVWARASLAASRPR